MWPAVRAAPLLHLDKGKRRSAVETLCAKPSASPMAVLLAPAIGLRLAAPAEAASHNDENRGDARPEACSTV
jgi:hypothetical protein